MSLSWHGLSGRSVSPLGCLLTCLAVAPLVERPVVAATISVDGGCTLVDAILAANSDSTSGGCTAGSGHDTLELSGDVALSTVYGNDTGTPTITSQITIEGGGWAIERAGGTPGFRIFVVTGSSTLTLRQVTVGNGRVDSDTSASPANGGCIANFATLELVDSSVSGCQAVADGNDARGGGIYNDGTLVVTNSTIRLNGAWSATHQALGGGIFTNAAENLTITNSTISGNYALSATAQGAGGGLYQLQANSCPVTNVTFSGNSADSGAALMARSTTTVRGSLFANSLFSESCAGDATELVDGGESQADDDSCATIPDTLTGLDPVLRDNGGPTMTHALLAGSSAILGAPTCGLAKDQRGAPRGVFCDSGAFEWGGCPELVLSYDTVVTEEVYESCQIKAGPDYCVAGPAGGLTLRAGREIELDEEFCVGVDAALTLEIDTDLVP